MIELIGAWLDAALTKSIIIPAPAHEAWAYVEHVEARPVSLEELSNSIADKWGVKRETLWNLAMAESSGGLNRIGDDGDSCGVIHINKRFFPEENAKCEDDEFVLNFAAQAIAEGREQIFTSCSCVQSARLLVKGLPAQNADAFIPNTTMQEGKIAILEYGGTRHVVAYKLSPTGIFAPLEGNFEPCMIKPRLIPWDELNDHLVGFYTPPASLALAGEEP